MTNVCVYIHTIGNVIKCEGLARSYIHPNTPTNLLPRNLLFTIVNHLKSFACEWYHVSKKRNGRIILNKIVYDKKVCIRCNNMIVLVRDGSMKRITYYCPVCQPYRTSFPTTSTPTPLPTPIPALLRGNMVDTELTSTNNTYEAGHNDEKS